MAKTEIKTATIIKIYTDTPSPTFLPSFNSIYQKLNKNQDDVIIKIKSIYKNNQNKVS